MPIDQANAAGQPSTRPRGRAPLVLGLLLAVMLCCALWILAVGSSPWDLLARRGVNRSSRVDVFAGSIHRNTRPGVKYVGDESCARCHREITESYQRHPMGRSLSPLATARESGGDERDGLPLFEAQGLEYSIDRRDGKVWHRESRRDRSGRIIAGTEAEAQFVVGSGRRGFSYLIDRDGYLVESPISYYSRAGQWGLSPGYDALNYHFDRPVQPGCLHCHTNRFESVSDTLNRYQPPIFRGHAIGCERCHGPGELHVNHPLAETEGGKDLTIVNPARLEYPLRDAVCEQCHLSGHQRVERAGLTFQDYRPGLPLHRFWTVLVPELGSTASKFVGQVEQMRASGCYVGSQGALGCISCHDPHRLPEPQEQASYYRGRCLQCHGERGCSLPESQRLSQSKEDRCTECHMPRSKTTSDVPHVTMTDHTIPRRIVSEQASAAGDPSSAPQGQRGGGRTFLVPFHRGLMTAAEREDAHRQLAIAYSREGPAAAAAALPWLDTVLAADPRDVPAWQAKGAALSRLNRHEEATIAFQNALKLAPNREFLLKEAAQQAELAGANARASEYWRRVIEVNPWRSDYRAGLAWMALNRQDWAAAAAACREVLRLDPADVQARQWLIESYTKLGNREASLAEQVILQGFGSADRAIPSSSPSALNPGDSR